MSHDIHVISNYLITFDYRFELKPISIVRQSLRLACVFKKPGERLHCSVSRKDNSYTYIHDAYKVQRFQLMSGVKEFGLRLVQTHRSKYTKYLSRKNANIFLLVHFHICFGCPKEPSHRAPTTYVSVEK